MRFDMNAPVSELNFYRNKQRHTPHAWLSRDHRERCISNFSQSHQLPELISPLSRHAPVVVKGQPELHITPQSSSKLGLKFGGAK
jgi:hypothetical protein